MGKNNISKNPVSLYKTCSSADICTGVNNKTKQKQPRHCVRKKEIQKHGWGDKTIKINYPTNNTSVNKMITK